jgi:hypothetical protein
MTEQTAQRYVTDHDNLAVHDTERDRYLSFVFPGAVDEAAEALNDGRIAEDEPGFLWSDEPERLSPEALDKSRRESVTLITMFGLSLPPYAESWARENMPHLFTEDEDGITPFLPAS